MKKCSNNCQTCGGTMTIDECSEYVRQHHFLPLFFLTIWGIIAFLVGLGGVIVFVFESLRN